MIMEKKIGTARTAEILQVVADYYGLSLEKLRSRSRLQELVEARSVYAYLAWKWRNRMVGNYSIAELIGHDHAMVSYYRRRVEKFLSIGDPIIAPAVEQLTQILTEKFGECAENGDCNSLKNS